MVDLHTHILPEMDDGAKTPYESVQMLTEAYAQGVRLLAATPHAVLHKQADLDVFLKRRRESALLLAEEAKKSRLPMPDLLLGAELHLDNNVNLYQGLEKLCIGNSPFLLVEFPFDKYDPYWGEWLHSMCIRGLHPIVAHIDRYLYVDKLLSDFAGLDITYQINASRMLGFWGRRFISYILSGSTPCVFASDMHNTTSRSCNMQEAFRKAQAKFPEDAAKLFSLRGRKMFQMKEM